jgi:hypothetical protein
MEPKKVWLESIKKTLAECYPELEITEKSNKSEFPYVIVRTYSAGVFAGNIVKREGREVTLQNVRRLWSWSGAASLSQLAMEGTNKPNACKFAMDVKELLVLEAIEILQVTASAEKNIKEVPIWKV